MLDKDHWLVDFVKNYDGNKLSIVATGGGVSLGLIALVPGASKVLHSFYCPYETRESIEFINKNYPPATREGPAFSKKAVSPDSAEELFMALWTKNKVDGHTCIHNIAVTAACSTTRYRRGENQAFIAFQNQDTLEDEIWQLKLSKAKSEAEHNLLVETGGIYMLRALEDNMIARTAIRLAAGFEEKQLEQDKADGTLTRFYSQITG
jgi:hypothetical protein